MYKSLTSFLPNILGLIGFYESKILEIYRALQERRLLSIFSLRFRPLETEF